MTASATYDAAHASADIADRCPRRRLQRCRRRSRRPWTGCPPAFAATVDHVLVCDDASPDDTYEVGAALRSSAPTLPLTVVSATREPRLRRQPEGRLRLGHRPRPRHRRAAARRRAVRPRGHRGPSSQPLVSGEADAVFGSRMMEQGRRPRGRHADLQVRRQPDPHHLPEQGDRASTSASGTAATAPTASTRWPTSTSTRTATTSTSTPRSSWASTRQGSRSSRCRSRPTTATRSATSTASRYAKDVTKDVLRFRARRMGFGTAVRPDRPAHRRSRGLRAQAVPALLPRRAARAGSARRDRARRCSTSAAPTASSAPSPARRATASTGVDLVKHAASASGSTRSSTPTSTPACPTSAAPYDVVVAGDILEHVDRPAAAAQAASRDRLAAERRGPRLGAELRALVPPRPGRPRPLRLRPARPARPRPRPLLHPSHLRAARRRLRPARSSSGRRRLAGRRAGARRRVVRARGRRAARPAPTGRPPRVWPTMFGYQFLYRLERASEPPNGST